MKTSIQLLVCLLAIISCANKVQSLTPNEILEWRKFLRLDRIEMPPYEVLKELENDVEIRKYSASKWVCSEIDTTATSHNRKDTRKMFGDLFRYISGKNDAKQKIAMTAPVTMDYTSKDNTKVNNDSPTKAEMCFYVPEKFNQNTPQPTNSRVYIKESPEFTAAVLMYSNYAQMEDYMEKRDVIINSLGSDANDYDTKSLVACGYDAPFQPLVRRNEVWVRKL